MSIAAYFIFHNYLLCDYCQSAASRITVRSFWQMPSKGLLGRKTKCWSLSVSTLYNGNGVYCARLYRGADKSLARPERKQATATKLCFCKPLKKQFRMLFVRPGLHGSNDLRLGRKRATFQYFFQSGRAKDLSALLYVQNMRAVDDYVCK